jgi:quercetin dioxygenase-like cupin family protein
MNKSNVTIAVLALSALALAAPQVFEARATNTISEASRRVLEQSPIPGTDEELRLMLVDFPPGHASVVHSHPVIGLCYVIEGKAISQYEGEEIKYFAAGQSYQDQANKLHVIFRNASSEESLRFICAAKIKNGAPFLQAIPGAR